MGRPQTRMCLASRGRRLTAPLSPRPGDRYPEHQEAPGPRPSVPDVAQRPRQVEVGGRLTATAVDLAVYASTNQNFRLLGSGKGYVDEWRRKRYGPGLRLIGAANLLPDWSPEGYVLPGDLDLFTSDRYSVRRATLPTAGTRQLCQHAPRRPRRRYRATPRRRRREGPELDLRTGRCRPRLQVAQSVPGRRATEGPAGRRAHPRGVGVAVRCRVPAPAAALEEGEQRKRPPFEGFQEGSGQQAKPVVHPAGGLYVRYGPRPPRHAYQPRGGRVRPLPQMRRGREGRTGLQPQPLGPHARPRGGVPGDLVLVQSDDILERGKLGPVTGTRGMGEDKLIPVKSGAYLSTPILVHGSLPRPTPSVAQPWTLLLSSSRSTLRSTRPPEPGRRSFSGSSLRTWRPLATMRGGSSWFNVGASARRITNSFGSRTSSCTPTRLWISWEPPRTSTPVSSCEPPAFPTSSTTSSTSTGSPGTSSWTSSGRRG